MEIAGKTAAAVKSSMSQAVSDSRPAARAGSSSVERIESSSGAYTHPFASLFRPLLRRQFPDFRCLAAQPFRTVSAGIHVCALCERQCIGAAVATYRAGRVMPLKSTFATGAVALALILGSGVFPAAAQDTKAPAPDNTKVNKRDR